MTVCVFTSRSLVNVLMQGAPVASLKEEVLSSLCVRHSLHEQSHPPRRLLFAKASNYEKESV